jgi:hypothetical protein
MTFEQFHASLKEPDPSRELPLVLKALWYDGKNDWESAHNIAQEITSADGSWIHGYLHRKEGDLGNASYWYSRAGRKMPLLSLEQEWAEIVKELLVSNKQ